MASVLVPVLYIGIVISSLLIFSHFYRKRNAGKLYASYFSSHPERDVYVTLLQQNDPPVHEGLLKAALIKRAMTDVGRVVKLREDKPALQNLLQKGSIGDDLWNSLLQAEKELEAEIMEVVAEANTFVEGWGAIIFQTAGELIANEKMRNAFDGTAASRANKEQRYGKVGQKIDLPAMQPVMMAGPPPPGTPGAAMFAAAQAQAQLRAQAQSQLQAQQSPVPVASPLLATPGKPVNGLAPPAPGRAETITSNGEASTPSKSVSQP
ncbi:Pre protein translocase subunit Sec66-domain-containing protein [Boletus edulis BED1]|uniref:Pre protein translocase subunit Sec66-domain-containing protein n=1 Tax=Boletus edulis BED1 TaxID=1328754 RepID=A0AAD4GJI3_BOLED|nr:Pre protein translocase subunit Sec66-domain-containing protein [Boletus edulis BED1]